MQVTQSTFPWSRLRRLALVVLTAALLLGPIERAQAVPTWQINTVDSAGDTGQHTSLALDAAGNPVISYYDVTNGNLMLVHCNDVSCTGGDESIQIVDSAGTNSVGLYTSLELDAVGNPVISYYDSTVDNLKLAHCDDANCAPGGESIQTVDGTGGLIVGLYTSLELDAAGNPVISYYDDTNNVLKLARCDDANCAPGGDSLQTVDNTAGANVGWYTSLALNAAGNPVISYYDSTNDDLKLVHCNDANCAGSNESIQTVDSTGNVGEDTSLALDAAGNPVISYHNATNTDLKLAHCDDANCAPGGDSLQTVDSTGRVGSFSSLALDAAGLPVIGYRDVTTTTNKLDLKLARCNDVNCAGGGEIIETVDSAGDVGLYISLALDAAGLPVISYYDATNSSLKLARLVDDAVDNTPPTVTINQAAGQADPTNTSPIHFTVIFSEPVTGFADGDVTLSGSAGATTATVAEQAPNNGTTYDVAVSGMTSDGTVVASVPAGVAKDGANNDNTASTSTDNTVNWVAQPGANAPVANDQAVTTAEDTPVAITLSASDADEDPLTYAVVGAPQHGTLSGTAPALTYTPAPNFSGTDSFTFRANDAQLASNLATVTVQVNAVNDAPQANSQTVPTTEGTAINITLTGSDVDGNPLTYALVAAPQHGTLQGTAPALTYTPNPGFVGNDQLTFRVNDGQANSNVAVVTIQVQAGPVEEEKLYLPLVLP